MKSAIGLCLLCAASVAGSSADAQKTADRTQPIRQNAQGEARSQAISFRNPYTSATVSAELLMPGRTRPVAAIVLVHGANQREQAASASLARNLAVRGFAVMSLPPVAVGGATEEDSLNTVASLHFLETKAELRGTPVGLVGYGDGVRLAATAASQGNPAAFLVLLGGAVVPDQLNSVPDKLRPGALPRDEAARSLAHVTGPVLILIGEYDRQGTHRNAAANADAIRASLDAGKHKNYTIKLMTDSDDLLAETHAGGAQSDTALPPATVWKAVADWTTKQARALDPNAGADETDAGQSKPIRLYPKSVYGPFIYRREMLWAPAIGGQMRPYGFWYW